MVKKREDGKLFLKLADEHSEEAEEMFDNFAMREPYDRIIRCLGFKFDTDIFNQ